jgi:hypothetical protein
VSTVDDLDLRLHAALHAGAGGDRPEEGPPEALRRHVVAQVRDRRTRRARTAGTLAVVVVAAVAVTSVVVGRSGGPSPLPSADQPVHRPPTPALSLPSAEAGPATAAAPTTTGPARFGSVAPCITVSVGGGPARCAGLQAASPGAADAPALARPTTVAVGQTVVVSVPAADGSVPITATGKALQPEGPDRFRAVAPGLSTLVLTGPTRWTLTVQVS